MGLVWQLQGRQCPGRLLDDSAQSVFGPSLQVLVELPSSSHHILESTSGEEGKGMPFPFKESSWKYHPTFLFVDYKPNLIHMVSPSCRDEGM